MEPDLSVLEASIVSDWDTQDHAPRTQGLHSVREHGPSTQDPHSVGEQAPSTLDTQSIGEHAPHHVTSDNENTFNDDNQTENQGISFF